MFNPTTFTVANEVPVLGNSEHPVKDYVISLMAKRIPGNKGVFFILTNDEKVITYRVSDRTLQFLDITFSEFKEIVNNKLPWPNPDNFVEVLETEKYIGNAVLRLLATNDYFVNC